MRTAMSKAVRRRGAARMDAAAGQDQVRQAGRARPSRTSAARRAEGGPADRGLPDRLVGARGEPRLPRRGSGWDAGGRSARRCSAARVSLVARHPARPAGARPGHDQGRSGPTRRRCRPGSARRWPTSPGRPSWPRRSRTAWPPGGRGRLGHRHGETRQGAAATRTTEWGNEDTVKLLTEVVDVLDAHTGTVRLKSKVSDADAMTLDTRSTKTVRARK